MSSIFPLAPGTQLFHTFSTPLIIDTNDHKHTYPLHQNGKQSKKRNRREQSKQSSSRTNAPPGSPRTAMCKKQTNRQPRVAIPKLESWCQLSLNPGGKGAGIILHINNTPLKRCLAHARQNTPHEDKAPFSSAHSFELGPAV